VGISDLRTLPHKVETAQWNCFHGNVRNLLAVLSQSNNCIEDGLSSLTRRGDSGSWKGNLVRELLMVLPSCCQMKWILRIYHITPI
jgi:hypothetical protein